MRIRTFFLVLAFLLSLTSVASAQNFAVKTNLLYDATATINLGAEFGLSKKWTLDVSANYNAWNFKDNMKWKHAFVQPEFRYWFCEGFNGHFLGFHALGGIYNIGGIKSFAGFSPVLGLKVAELANHRYEGWFFGAGLAYGYSFILSEHWNLEAEIGVGLLYAPNSRKFNCEVCAVELDKTDRLMPSLTKAAISLVYLF